MVFDPTAGTVRAAGLGSPLGVREALGGSSGSPAGPAGPSGAVLQQPGPDGDVLLVATRTGLVPLSLSGEPNPPGRVTLPAAAAGSAPVPAAPVRLGGCAHAAWAGTDRIYYGRTCADQVTSEAVAVEVPVRTRVDGARLRVNRAMVVLNDLDSGGLWDLDSPKPVRIDDWTAVIPPPQAGNANVKPDPALSDDQQVRRPPEANPDDLSASWTRSHVHPARARQRHRLAGLGAGHRAGGCQRAGRGGHPREPERRRPHDLGVGARHAGRPGRPLHLRGQQRQLRAGGSGLGHGDAADRRRVGQHATAPARRAE